MHACDTGDLSSIPGRDMFVSGALLEDVDDLGQVSSNAYSYRHRTFYSLIILKFILLPNPVVECAEKDVAGHLLVLLPGDVARLVPEVTLQSGSPALRQQLP